MSFIGVQNIDLAIGVPLKVTQVVHTPGGVTATSIFVHLFHLPPQLHPPQPPLLAQQQKLQQV